jgi:glycosyltransferase involved in cell wall biosynthesis
MSDRKKIVFAAGLFPPDIGGPATFAQILFSELKNDKNYELKVIAYGELKNVENITRISRQQNIFWRYLKYFFALRRVARQADVIYAFDLISVGVPCALFKFFNRRIKLMVRLGGDYQWERALGEGSYGDTMEKYYEEKRFSLTEKVIFKLNNFVLRLSDVIIFNSEYLQDIYLNKRGGIETRQSVIVKNIQPDFFISNEEQREGESIKLLFAGRFAVLKNLPRLVEAMAIVKKDLVGKKIILEMVGEGPEESKIRDVIYKNGLEKDVAVLPKVSREILKQKIAACDIVVLVALTEINANFFAEAAILEKSIIITNKSEEFYLKIKQPSIYFVNPLSVKDIAEKIKLAINELRLVKAPNGNVLANIFWPKEKVVEAHKKLFQ